MHVDSLIVPNIHRFSYGWPRIRLHQVDIYLAAGEKKTNKYAKTMLVTE